MKHMPEWHNFKEAVKIAKEQYGIELPKKETSQKSGNGPSLGIPNKDLLEKYEVIYTNEKGEPKVSAANLATLIYKEYNLHFLTTEDGEMHTYNGGYYEPKGGQKVRKISEYLLGDIISEHTKNETIAHLRDKNYLKREIFDATPFLLNLRNGIYNLQTNEFISNSPEYYFLGQLPVTYNKDAQIDKIKTFLEQVLKPEDIPLFQEIVGYCLYRSYPIQKAFMFLGNGANGKSVASLLIKAMLGKENVSAITLQDINKFRFTTANLYGKMANIYPDIPDEGIQKTGLFKTLVGGDMITADKKFKEPFNFQNYAKLIFSANKLPEAHDDSDAYFRRWIFITFPNKFEGRTADKSLLEKLTTEEELSGLFNWGLEGLERLLENGDFTNTVTTDEMRETYQRLASPIKAFMDDCIVVSPEDYIQKDDLYIAFCEYCKQNSLPIMAKNVFSMKLHEYVRVEDYRTSSGGKRIQTWRGMRFRTSGDDKEEKNEEKPVKAVSPVKAFSVPKSRVDKNRYLDIRYSENPDSTDGPDNREATEEVS